MRQVRWVVCAVPIAVTVAPAVVAQKSTTTAFVHVTVVPMDRERLLPDNTVLVRGNRIVAIGPAAKVEVPAGAVTIDGTGKYLMPGLADMHSHTVSDAGLTINLANGITTMRDMTDGRTLLQLRYKGALGMVMPPRVYGTSRVSDCWGKPQLTIDQCFEEMVPVGYDMIKFYGEYGDPVKDDSIVVAAKKAHLRVGGHVLPGPGLERAFELPYKSIEHLWGYLDFLMGTPQWPYGAGGMEDSSGLDTASWLKSGYRLDAAKLRDLAVRTQKVGAWNAPTLVVMEGLKEDAVFPPLQKRATEQRFELNFQIVKALHDAGAGLLLGVDVLSPLGSGFLMHRELELLQRAGLTPYEVLKTGTLDAAVYLGTQESSGTVAVGKFADLVLLDGNPLKDLHNVAAPAGVMADGRWYGRADLDVLLDALEAKECYIADLRREAARHQGIKHATWTAAQTRSDKCP